MGGKWSHYRFGQFREEEWSCYRTDQFNGRRMVTLQRWSVLMRGEQSCYGGGQFKEGRMVML